MFNKTFFSCSSPILKTDLLLPEPLNPLNLILLVFVAVYAGVRIFLFCCFRPLPQGNRILSGGFYCCTLSNRYCTDGVCLCFSTMTNNHRTFAPLPAFDFAPISTLSFAVSAVAPLPIRINSVFAFFVPLSAASPVVSNA